VLDAMQPSSYGFLWGLVVGVDEAMAVVNSFISSCTIDERPMQSSHSLKVSCRPVCTSHTTSSCTFPTLILCCCFLFWHFAHSTLLELVAAAQLQSSGWRP